MPRFIRFQGKLGDSSGAALDGYFDLTFRLYGAEAGGTPLWEENQNSVDIQNGLIDVELGGVMPLDLPFDAQYWLGVEVGYDGEMSPRFKLTTVPYSFSSGN